MTDIDLTPVEPDNSGGRGRLKNWLLLGGILAVGVFVLVQALTSARVFFLNVDEAVAQRHELGNDTFRMQGVVSSEQERTESGAIVFFMAFDGVEVEVTHIGEEPTELFELDQNVVVEGRWDNERFVSDQILVKHSESYVAENEDRPGVGVE